MAYGDGIGHWGDTRTPDQVSYARAERKSIRTNWRVHVNNTVHSLKRTRLENVACYYMGHCHWGGSSSPDHFEMPAEPNSITLTGVAEPMSLSSFSSVGSSEAFQRFGARQIQVPRVHQCSTFCKVSKQPAYYLKKQPG